MKENFFLEARSRCRPLFFIVLYILGMSFRGFGQQITGTVADRNGNAIAGATVEIKGKRIGTTTDAKGNYKIPASPEDILYFSYVGYQVQDIAVSNRTTINVTLELISSSLNDVIVTALGIRKQEKRLGYSATTVKTEELTTNRTPNVGNSLQGKVAGVAVSPVTTGAGGTSKVRIRGISSFNTDNGPLMIVNGVPMNNGNNSQTRGDKSGGATHNSFSDGGDGLISIDPDDIESMTVLKGATAAALYGSRAQNGAIVIITKTGRKGKGIGVDYNSNIVMDKAMDETDWQYQYGEGENGVRPATVAAAQNAGTFSFGEAIDGKPTIQFDGQTKPYAAFKNAVRHFYQTGYTWTNTVAFSGGSDNGGYRVSLNDMKNKAIMPNSGFERQGINFGMNYSLGKHLTMAMNGNYSHEYNRNAPNVTAQNYNSNITIYNLANTLNVDDMKAKPADANGNETSISRFTTRTNPYWWANEHFENIKRDRLFGNIALKYSLLDWLYIQGRISQDYNTRSFDYNVPTGTRTLPAAPAGTYSGEYYQEVTQNRERNYDFLVNANRKFHDFGVDLSLGGNQYRNINMNNNALADNFYVRGLYTIANGVTKDPEYYFSDDATNSLYGVLDLSYKNFLFLSGTARNDWFSELNPKSNHYLYPSVSGSFVFSELMPSSSWLSYGKLRVAYASVGGTAGAYQNNLYYGLNASTLNGVVFGYISNGANPNPNLKPLAVKEYEAGVEAHLFNERMNFDFTVYKKKTINEILPAQISTSTGYSSTVVNLGQLENQGLEFLVGGYPVKNRNFSWNISLNGSFNKSKVLQLSGGQSGIVVATAEFNGQIAEEVGKPLNSIQGNSYLRAPDGQIVHQNGVPSQGPLKTFGSGLPTSQGGVTNSFAYKTLRFSFLVDGRFGGKLLSQTNFNAYRIGLSKATLAGRASNSIIGQGVMADPANAGKYVTNTVSATPESYYSSVRSTANIEPFIYKSDFLKLRQITIGYDFTGFLSRTCPVKGLVLNFVANNVAILKKYTSNIDPEMIGITSDREAGLEGGSMPLTRSMGLNLSVKF